MLRTNYRYFVSVSWDKKDIGFIWLKIISFQASDQTAFATRSEFESQSDLISELQNRLENAELKLIEGEKLRKKLHNTILVWIFYNS